MPLNEYICLQCSHQFEEFIRSSDEEIVRCPHCDTSKVDKLFPLTGGYFMNSGPSSIRPKGAGSPRRQKKE